MSKINLLDSSVFNRIAAGEVVEKPASVAKELIENSIDSGATKIDVEIADGGKYIKVTDNGCGMEFDDLQKAFLPHATSKICAIKDLNAISTLGFRGEALPSIASVAKVTLRSRRREDDLGGEIEIENGRELKCVQTGSPIGTSVTVCDLFKNVPARLKFLRPDRSEEGDISSLMQKIILANYKISFSYSVNGKEMYRSDGKGLKEAIYAVYGSNFLKEHEFFHSDMPDIVAYGYVNKPAFSKHNRSFQTLIVNGRCVSNTDISFWIYNIYSNYLMKRQYPSYVVFIDLPADMVDINVHPSKMEVKFVDFDRLRKMLTRAISDVIVPEVAKPKLIEIAPESDADDPSLSAVRQRMGDSSEVNDSRRNAVFTVSDKFSDTEYPKFERPKPVELHAPPSDVSDIFDDAEPTLPSFAINQPKARQYELFHDLVAEKSGIEQDFYADLSDRKYCGKLFNTYIMLEKGNEIVMLDQHATHEKLLYDKFRKSVDDGNRNVQDLLVPYTFEVSADEAIMLEANADEISALGFTVGRLSGNSFSLSAVPLVLSDIDLKDFVSVLIESLKKDKLSKHGFLRETLMQSACKAAVKGKDDLSEAEVERLIADIADKRIDLFCPHGRPIAIKITRDEIEKWFKRIV